MIFFHLNKITIGTKNLIKSFCFLQIFSNELIPLFDVAKTFLAFSSVGMVHMEGSFVGKATPNTSVSQGIKNKTSVPLSLRSPVESHFDSLRIKTTVIISLLLVIKVMFLHILSPVSFGHKAILPHKLALN